MESGWGETAWSAVHSTNDRTPSMKVDSRFYCFGCGLPGCGSTLPLCCMDWGNGKPRSGFAEDFGVSYEKSGNAPPDRKRHNRSQPRQKISGAEISGNGTVLFPGAMRLSAPAGALKTAHAPQPQDAIWHPLCGSVAEDKLHRIPLIFCYTEK